MYKVNTAELKKKMIDNQIETIVQLSKATDINRDTLGGILSGKKTPSSMVMYAIAEALNMSSEECGIIFFDK